LPVASRALPVELLALTVEPGALPVEAQPAGSAEKFRLASARGLPLGGQFPR